MSKTVKSFEELNVWQNAKELVSIIYKFTKTEKFFKDYSIRDQTRRSSVSIMSNIAEGFERGSNKEFVQFLYIAKGSCAEVRSLLYIALELQYIAKEDFSKAKDECMKLSSMISNLIRYLNSKKEKRQQLK
jgi:four helix bundle protein